MNDQDDFHLFFLQEKGNQFRALFTTGTRYLSPACTNNTISSLSRRLREMEYFSVIEKEFVRMTIANIVMNSYTTQLLDRRKEKAGVLHSAVDSIQLDLATDDLKQSLMLVMSIIGWRVTRSNQKR